MNVIAVTSWGTACGIADYAAQLQAAFERTRVGVTLVPYRGSGHNGDPLDPEGFLQAPLPCPDALVWINHHAALHSRWTPEHVRQLQARGIPVVVTLHDTLAGEGRTRNSAQLLGLWEAASETIVHEPVADMPGVWVIRQGVPPAMAPTQYNFQKPGQPILGTVGFNFPWKNYDRLAEVTRDVGWALLILSNNATQEDADRWRTLNSQVEVHSGFRPTYELVSLLTGCDATAFCYTCANTGTSGAIRLGIAARKPLFAFQDCRQFRDLVHAEFTEETCPLIRWITDFPHLLRALKHLDIPKVDSGMHYLAARDSWDRQAGAYLEAFQQAWRAEGVPLL